MNVNICQNGARTDVEQLWHWHFGHGMPHVDLAEEHLDQGLTIHLILPTDEWKEGRRSRLQSCPVACPLSCSSSARFDLSGHPFQLAADFHVAVRFGSPTGGTTNYVTVSGQDLSLSLSISLSHVNLQIVVWLPQPPNGLSAWHNAIASHIDGCSSCCFCCISIWPR